MAIRADRYYKKGDNARLQSAVTLLQESFSKALNDRTEFVVSSFEILEMIHLLIRYSKPFSLMRLLAKMDLKRQAFCTLSISCFLCIFASIPCDYAKTCCGE